MNIRIKTFSSIRESCGFDEKNMIVSEGMSVREIIDILGKSFPSIKKKKEELLFAVNEQYCSPDRELTDNDVLALFPPVSGG